MQPAISAKAEFSVRIDMPDGNEPESFTTCDLADLPEHLTTVVTEVNDITLYSAPILIEVRRVK